jgi:sigma-B regulation protein RsbU (phosphoserine phosphatase)
VLVNAVLTQNIEQLGEDKYMTMTALRRSPDGVIAFAGAHQDLFIYRAAGDAVEIAPTEGLWLGLRRDATGGFVTRELRLSRHDVLVLLTDGVTEAVRDGAMFDTHGVRRAITGAKGKTAQQLLDGVLQALEGFAIEDDATLLVIRQLTGDQAEVRRSSLPVLQPRAG